DSTVAGTTYGGLGVDNVVITNLKQTSQCEPTRNTGLPGCPADCSGAPNGTPCNDGNACTQTDTCQTGVCTGANAVVCSASDQCHNAGTCNTTTGACSNPSKPNDTGCNDNNACTKTDSCQAGVCTGGNPVVCAAFDQCHVKGVCRPENGTCTNPSAPNNTPCNDGDGCSDSDTCQAAICTPGPAHNCDDQNGCTTDTCEAGACANRPQSGCIQCGAGLPSCDDGNACTAESCVAGKCEFTNLPGGS